MSSESFISNHSEGEFAFVEGLIVTTMPGLALMLITTNPGLLFSFISTNVLSTEHSDKTEENRLYWQKH